MKPTDHRPTARRFVMQSALSLLAAAGLVAMAACGAAPDGSEERAAVHQPLDATPQTCAAACDQLDACGQLVQHGIDHGACVSICTSAYTEQDALWASSASCSELEQALANGQPPSQCAQACDKVDGCGLLAQFGVDPADCESICEADFSEAQVGWALSASCDEIDAVLAPLFSTPPPPSPCEQACDKVDGCGLLTQYGIDLDECELICDHAYGDQLASAALQFSCGEIDAYLVNSPPPSACDLGCAKVDSCGILAQQGISLSECMTLCQSNYTAAQLGWALTATCSELEQAL